MKLGVAVLLAGIACAGAAAAAGTAPPRAQVCGACHGAEGISVGPDIPNLAGQRKEYLLRQLQAFRDGSRKNDLMSVVARQLDDAELAPLAAYWSSLPSAGSGAAAAPHAAALSKMVLPADFPNAFTEYSRAEDMASKTVALRYATAAAIAAARGGRPLPHGAAIVVVTHAAELDAAGKPLVDTAGRWRLGKLRSYAGMESRAGWGDTIPDTLRNGDWNYGLWNAERASTIGNLQPRCLACHKPKAGDSYVFTLDELRGAR